MHIYLGGWGEKHGLKPPSYTLHPSDVPVSEMGGRNVCTGTGRGDFLVCEVLARPEVCTGTGSCDLHVCEVLAGIIYKE